MEGKEAILSQSYIRMTVVLFRNYRTGATPEGVLLHLFV